MIHSVNAVVCLNKTTHIAKEALHSKESDFTAHRTLCGRAREGEIQEFVLECVSCSECKRLFEEALPKRSIFQIEARIDPNGESFECAERQILKETASEFQTSSDEGEPYRHRIVKSELGKVRDASNLGGWLKVLMWLAEPTEEEIEAGKREVLQAMAKRVENIAKNAERISEQYAKIAQ